MTAGEKVGQRHASDHIDHIETARGSRTVVVGLFDNSALLQEPLRGGFLEWWRAHDW